MITEIKLQYFKSFVENTIALKDLTLLTGLNSSGKSSIMQAMRLINNTLKENKNILLEGHGSFEEILNNFSKDKNINFEINDSFFKKLNVNIWKDDFKVVPFNYKFPQIIYISADRFGPRSFIPIINNYSEELTIGSQGENILQFIEQYENQELNEILRHEKSEGVNFIFNLKAWLQEISPNIKFRYEINKRSDSSFSLFNDHRSTNVGFGLSYTLPVIVAALAGTFIKNSIILLENPEAHLHPKGQTAISKLIALCVSAGAQIIVETHSDHLFDGIRIAVKNELISNEQVQIHWFELDSNDNTQVYSPIIDKNGRLNEWPKYMFDQFEINSSELL